MKRVAIYFRQTGPDTELLADLRQAVEDRGDTVVAAYIDDGRIVGRGKHAGWKALIANLDVVDQVVVAAAGDLPGRTVAELLKILSTFRDHGVGLCLHAEHIDTSSAGFALLEIVEAYRAAKLSEAIKIGQAKALAAGKRIGRPTIPPGVLTGIRACLVGGAGIRPTARRFNISPASVINIRRSMTEVGAEAA
jgi:DNA invertase Pin-like site-specific DNA recombinase